MPLPIWQKLLNLIFPARCIVCGQSSEHYICRDCFGKIKEKTQQVCPICRQPSALGAVHPQCRSKTALDGVLVAAEGEQELLRKIIHRFKYRYLRDLENTLGNFLARAMIRNLDNLKDQIVLVPVPLHPRRQRERGFNQAQRFCEYLAKNLELIVSPILRRDRYTSTQTRLSRSERLENLLGAFTATVGVDPDKIYVLVDDVYTTGATLEECAKALRAGGAKKVWGLVVSRGV